MNLFRKILFPFALLYGLITAIRNYLFDKGILKSYSFDVPVIAVGNLSVGGTGKTPQIEYLIRLLSEQYKVATLSRGYKRKSKGFILADSYSTPTVLGDEPFQFYQKFKNVQVAVDANRRNGIEQLLGNADRPQVILLDDAYQHRKVKAGFYILLTAYDDLYTDDFLLPVGNLRECRSGAKRANIVVVTKCPEQLSKAEQLEIRIKLKLTLNQELFFSTIAYDNYVYSTNGKMEVEEIKSTNKLLLAGIAKPDSFFTYLKNQKDQCLTFADHHHFTGKDVLEIKKNAEGKLIITTEKDYVRLKDSMPEEQLFYLSIQSQFVDSGNLFNKIILNYVGTSTGIS